MFPSSGKQLYVGEGDFSLTKSLSKHHNLPKGTIVSCFSESLTDEAIRNKEFLEGQGITVLVGVDATLLKQHSVISKLRYDYIIFNFPHTGKKMKIHLCRKLLMQFLCASEPLLTDNGQVWVTLCAGQGGTPGDTTRRAWGNSWQLTAQAATAGLQLLKLWPFERERYPGYRPTGNRGSQLRGFHTSRGVAHVLTRGRVLQPEDLRRRLCSVQHSLLPDEPAALTSYWYSRLHQPAATVAEQLVQRLTPAPITRHTLVRHSGIIRPVGSGDADPLATRSEVTVPEGCHQWCLADLDCDTAQGTACAPLKTLLTVTCRTVDDGVAAARTNLAAMGLPCKVGCGGEGQRLMAGCGDDSQLCVASVRPHTHVLASELDWRTVRESAEKHTTCDNIERQSGAVTIYQIDSIAACLSQSGDDWRPAARTDFTSLSPLVFSSLHPPSYTFDMSFWVDGDVGGEDGGGEQRRPTFSMQRLSWALRSLLADILVGVSSIDEYTEPGTGRRARTVRVVYQQVSGPLGPERCRRLHLEWLPPLLSRLIQADAR